MKLLIISHKPLWRDARSPSGFSTDGGFPRHVEALSGLFDKTIVCTPCLAEEGHGLSFVKGRNVQVLPLPPLPRQKLLRRLLTLPFILLNLAKLLRAIYEADFVHTPIPGDIGTIGMVLAWACRKPLFVRHCGNWERRLTLAERFWRWFMESNAEGRNIMMATGIAPDNGSSGSRVQWIFSASMWRSEMYPPASARTLRAAPRVESLRLATACRLVPGKGVDLLLRAGKALVDRGFKVCIDVFGDGPERSALEKLSEELGLEKYVRFGGRLSQAELLERLSEVHFFVFLSTSEGFPKAPLEALARGVPIVVSSLPVLESLARDGAGVVIKTLNAEEVAERIEQCCHPCQYERMVEAALVRAQEYSLERWVKCLGEAFNIHWKRFGFRMKNAT